MTVAFRIAGVPLLGVRETRHWMRVVNARSHSSRIDTADELVAPAGQRALGDRLQTVVAAPGRFVGSVNHSKLRKPGQGRFQTRKVALADLQILRQPLELRAA